MTISYDGLLALLGSLLIAMLPLPRRAEGLRIGLFAAVLGFVFYDALRRTPEEHEPVAIRVEPEPEPVIHPERLQSDSDDRLDARQLLTDFSILRLLRRQGAVSDQEFEVKKADILRRV